MLPVAADVPPAHHRLRPTAGSDTSADSTETPILPGRLETILDLLAEQLFVIQLLQKFNTSGHSVEIDILDDRQIFDQLAVWS